MLAQYPWFLSRSLEAIQEDLVRYCITMSYLPKIQKPAYQLPKDLPSSIRKVGCRARNLGIGVLRHAPIFLYFIRMFLATGAHPCDRDSAGHCFQRELALTA